MSESGPEPRHGGDPADAPEPANAPDPTDTPEPANTPDPTDTPDPADAPEPVRTAVIRLAAQVLGEWELAQVPPPLRQVHRFAPRRRATAGAGPLWNALRGDDGFRHRVAHVWSAARPELADALVAGAEPAEAGRDTADAPSPTDAPSTPAPGPIPARGPTSTADALDRAVGAWLLRPEGWAELVAASAQVVADPHPSVGKDGSRSAAEQRAERAEAEVVRLTARLGAVTVEVAAVGEERDALRREQRRLRADADRARSDARGLLAQAEAEREAARVLADRAAEQLRSAEELRRVAEAERSAVRSEAAVARDLAQARVRLLLDTVVDAGTALRQELALPPMTVRPADLVAPAEAAAPAPRVTSRGRSEQDTALLDELLALPHAHLLVDGYNVSKSGWPGLSLAEQRDRLVDGLANLAARTGAEVTCCFDGRDVSRTPRTLYRSVRVLFSVGEIADDLIRRLVRAEPAGRVVVVVTSDRQVATDTEAWGARVLPSATLLARLGRL